MALTYHLYLNGYFFARLLSSEDFSDRPETYRLQEQALWTAYQLLRLAQHEVVVREVAGRVVLRTRGADVFKEWVALTYHDFAPQLDHLLYTRYPQPQSLL